MKKHTFNASIFAVVLMSGCGGGGGDGFQGKSATEDRTLQGGDTTVSNRDAAGFSTAAANLNEEEDAQHERGDLNFARVFSAADGLGPIFNHSSCQGCHLGDGRGRPDTHGSLSEALVRFSTPDGTPDAPGIGGQGQDHAIAGYSAEISANLTFSELPGSYDDGTSYSLRQPILRLSYANGTALPAGTLTSYRTAPPVFGMGLLDEVPESEILSREDPNDDDGDGVSGRANYPTDVSTGKPKLGRFGWKCNTPTTRQQVSAAYVNDMGVTNPVFTSGNLDTGASGTDIDESTLSDTIFYVKTLGVPAAASAADPIATHGEELFRIANCSGCHVQTMHTGNSSITSLSNQTFHPYTDLLIHDMGAGLADNRPDVLANGNEWRTTPLWGIGITKTVQSDVSYLHDGRARTLEEAILWHGGEAEAAKNSFKGMSVADRAALIAFLRSL